MNAEQKQAAPLIGSQGRSQRVSSEELLAGNGRLEIVHDNEVYRLSRTKNGKLILTK
ncbi:hemin uptake protein HemP [Nitrincola iocasae]|uniref:Hemin uptake protein HemP n=2 Tax=Nitrincola iocasae TaxID=2614693 RepID=A0A5J6LJT4_9GAMM|nr:hemin uptake protein HemP [Nitrincola iocasae]